MRLSQVESGRGMLGRLVLRLLRWRIGQRVPDVLRVALYRRNFFGKHFGAYVQEALRGPSSWSLGELELMAAYVSRQNRCSF